MPRTTAQHIVWEDLAFFLTDLHCATSKVQEINTVLFLSLERRKHHQVRNKGTNLCSYTKILKFNKPVYAEFHQHQFIIQWLPSTEMLPDQLFLPFCAIIIQVTSGQASRWISRDYYLNQSSSLTTWCTNCRAVIYPTCLPCASSPSNHLA